MSIYEEVILDHYQHPRNNAPLPDPTAAVDVNNPLCGDKLRFEIHDTNGVIDAVGFSGEGCAISVASASLLSEYAKGKTKKELKSLNKEDVLGLLGIELTPNRMKCALLSWEALVKAVSK